MLNTVTAYLGVGVAVEEFFHVSLVLFYGAYFSLKVERVPLNGVRSQKSGGGAGCLTPVGRFAQSLAVAG